jgi:hypothetical protein
VIAGTLINQRLLPVTCLLGLGKKESKLALFEPQNPKSTISRLLV